jgi:hypothetical protein
MHRRSLALLIPMGFALSLTHCRRQDQSAVKEAEEATAADAGKFCSTSPRDSKDLGTLGYGPTCDQIVQSFPKVTEAAPEEDKRVLCPFLRLTHRMGVWQSEIQANLDLLKDPNKIFPLKISGILAKVTEFGCGQDACGMVAMGVSAGQNAKDPSTITQSDIVDIGRLHLARGTAHDCGYTFALGQTVVNDEVRAQTLQEFKNLAKPGPNGELRLELKDLIAVKQIACARDLELSRKTNAALINQLDPAKGTLVFTGADTLEVGLIWSYLGGVDNGYITYQDVELFLSARLPRKKTKYLLDSKMQAHLIALLSAP